MVETLDRRYVMFDILDSNAAQAALIVWCIVGYYVWFDAVQYMVRKYESYGTKFRWQVALDGGIDGCIVALAILLVIGPPMLLRRRYCRHA